MSGSYAQSWASALSVLGQSLVELPASNTQSLLSKASYAIHQRRGEADATLARLKQLNPTVASHFQAKEDTLSEVKLRLISSSSPQQAQEPSARNFDSFIVISYCWHYPEWPIAPSAQPIAPGWEVSLPMVQAAMSLRKDTDEGIWLDKLCINQNDTTDKKVHIGAMDIIYKSARRVIILLEDVQLTEEETTAGLAYAGFYEDMCQEVMKLELEGPAKGAFVNGYFPDREEASDNLAQLQSNGGKFAKKLLGARWFSRAWCAHESRVTIHGKVNNPLFLCFAHDGRVLSFEFRSIFYLSVYLSDIVEPPMTLTGPSLTSGMNDPNPQSLRQRWWRIQHLMPQHMGVDNSSPMYHLVSIHLFGCAKQGDLISIALNTSNIPVAFTGEATNLGDVIWLFTLLVLASSDVAPLAMIGSKLKTPEMGVISWAIRPNYGSVDEALRSPRIDSITSVSKEYIELDLLLFKSSPHRASNEAFDLASEFVEQHNLITLLEEAAASADKDTQTQLQLIKGEVHRIKNDSGPLKIFLPMWLAHAIDSGLEWTVRFPDVMKAETEHSWSQGTLGEDANPKLTNAAIALLDHFVAAGGHASKGEGGEERESTIYRLTRFLTCILDPRLPSWTISPRSLPCGNGDFAFTASVSNRSYIAVPAAIAHLPAWMKRAWAIDPFDPTGVDANEAPSDHLADINMQLKGDESAEDIFPVLSSDYEDRRRPREVKKGTWRLRRREEIFGCQPFFRVGELYPEDGPVMLLKSQRVYGAEDYDWAAISAAAREFEAKHGIQQSSKAQDS